MLIVILLFALSLNIFGWCFHCFYNWSRSRKDQSSSNSPNNELTNSVNINNEETAGTNSQLLLKASRSAFPVVRATGELRRAKYSIIIVMIAINTIDLLFFTTYALYLFHFIDDEEIKILITTCLFMINHSVNIIIYFVFDSQFRLTCSEIFSKVVLNFQYCT